MKSVWNFFTSLRLTVTLLALSVLLVFFGTLSQVDDGLWKAQKIWFESYIVAWEHLQLFGLKFVVPIFPGGYLIGFTLLAGLIAAFIKRFAWRKDKIGIHLTHGGVILLLLGQLMAQELAVESYIEFKEGETKTYTEDHLKNELAFIRDGGGEEERWR
jgi:cytochrome c biogenesis factor